MTREEWIAAVPAHRELLTGWIEVGRPLWDDIEKMGNDLKEAAHAALYQDPSCSEQLARGLIRLGERAEREGLSALGEMALGDALRAQNRMREAYALLDRAAERFEAIGDEVGWARTRIGWLGNLHDLETYPPPQPIIERAYEIFKRHRKWRWLSGLCGNSSQFFIIVNDYEEALKWACRAVLIAERVEEAEGVRVQQILGMLKAIECYVYLGRYEEAERAIKEILPLAEPMEQDAPEVYIEVLTEISRYYLNTGRYAVTLSYLYEARRLTSPPSWWYYYVCRLIAGTCLRLNRLEESEALLRDLLERLAREIDSPINPNELFTRLTYTQLLIVQKRWSEAWEILAPAIEMMERMPEVQHAWRIRAHQYQLLLLHRLGEREAVGEIREIVRGLVRQTKEPFGKTEGYLCLAEVADSVDEQETALAAALEGCREIAWLRWKVLRTTALVTDDPVRRREALVQAVDDLDTVQSSLAASFHATYLSEAGAVYHDLIALYLDEGEVTRAWETLERAKSRALLNSMIYQAATDGASDSPLFAELERLQIRHYGMVNARLEGHASWEEVRALEREIEKLQEEIQVEAMGRRELPSVPPSIVPEAPPGSDLIGYFLVRDEVHAFVHNGRTYHHLRLSTTPGELNQLAVALSLNVRTTPGAPDSWVPSLTQQLDRVLEQLDAQLLEPLRPFLRHNKLIVVPHGLLHQLPFSLLRRQGTYLLERRAVRVVPSARLVSLRPEKPRAPAIDRQHLVVSHSWNGRLPRTEMEAEMVAETMGNTVVLAGPSATRRNFREAATSCDILHISAHGEHRADAPHFSFIQLEDGQLSAGELFRLSLNSSLVTLSACDTGQVVVYPGDDPVGLWRGFLAAGARSLLVSLWQLEDGCALRLMRGFYERVGAGESKMAALRAVQRQWLDEAEGRWRHPFYWGALQLIGNGGPLLE